MQRNRSSQAFARASEKLRDAVHKLVTGTGDARSRTRRAYKSLSGLEPRQLPAELREDLKWVHRQVRRYGPLRERDGATIKNATDHTLGRIRNRTASVIADKIYQMYEELRHLKEKR